MRVLSLFAGIGGIDLGLEAHGCTTVAYSEIDPYASRVMARRFPNAVNLGDITTIDWEVANREHGPFDIICGGFPCQDISLAGKGAGIADGTRSGLWSCYADAVRVIRPRGVLVENVSALLARGIDRVLGDLAACGYDAEWDCVPAASVGAPHLRDRLFVVAYRTDAAEDVDAFWHGADTYRDRRLELPPLQRPAEQGVEVEPGHDAPGLRGSDERRDGGAAASATPPTRGARLAPDADGTGRGEHGWPRPAPEELATAQRRRDVPDFGWAADDPDGGRHAVPIEEVRAGWDSTQYTGWWSTEPGVGRVAHGVPSRVDRLRCLGNAVVPQVAEHVAGILMERMDGAA